MTDGDRIDQTVLIRFERKILDPHLWIDSPTGTCARDALTSFDLRGWLKTPEGMTPCLHLGLRDGTVRDVALNRVRDNVRAYLHQRYDDRFSARCGFSIVVDLSEVAMVGYSIQGPVRWEYDVKTTHCDALEPVRAIFGPSHVYRMELAIKDRLIPDIRGRYRMIRKGGMPIWSQLVTDGLKADQRQDLTFIVGDFRFGNQILEDQLYPSLDRPWPQTGIEKHLITPANDSFLYRMCCQKIKDIIARKGAKARFLFWDLSIREYENKARGKYLSSGEYRHPIWNYADAERMFSDNMIGSRDILDKGDLLYIDSSAHPSMLGFAYLWHKLNCDGPFDIDDRQARLTAALSGVFSQSMGDTPVHCAGSSVFIRYLIAQTAAKTMPLPPSISFDLSDRVEDIAPQEHLVYVLPIRSFKLTDARIAYFIARYREQIARLRKRHGRVSVLPYDNWACEVTSQRRPYKDWYSPKTDLGRTSVLERHLCPDDQRYRISRTVNPTKLLEINHVLSPNLYGVMEILLRLTSELSRFQIEQAYETVVHSVFQMDDRDADRHHDIRAGAARRQIA